MDNLTREYIISFYDRQQQQFGDKPESLGWTREGQMLHYKALLDINNTLNGSTILDFGCGKGDFYGFLKEKGIAVRYTGLDINENFITIARQRFPECTFKTFDINRDLLTEQFDYVFLCGVFNLKVQHLADTIRRTLIVLFKHCRIAMGFNALSSYGTHKAFYLNYLDPEEMITFAKSHLSLHVVLRDDRIPGDFTLFIYRHIPSSPLDT